VPLHRQEHEMPGFPTQIVGTPQKRSKTRCHKDKPFLPHRSCAVVAGLAEKSFAVARKGEGEWRRGESEF
jgi:hypothetical protein